MKPSTFLPLVAGRYGCCVTSLLAQNTSTSIPPVIDVHVHAMDGSFPSASPMCPNTAKFTASDPARKEASFGWVQEECALKLYPSANGEYMKDVLAEMERLNVTAVVFGDPKSVEKWKDAAPGRVIPGTSFSMSSSPETARSGDACRLSASFRMPITSHLSRSATSSTTMRRVFYGWMHHQHQGIE